MTQHVYVALILLAASLTSGMSAFGQTATPAGTASGKVESPLVYEANIEFARAGQVYRVPSVLLKALAFRMSGFRQSDVATGAALEKEGRIGLLGVPTGKGRADAARLRTDWQYNIAQGARHLELCWNRAPILGFGSLEDGRNILEAWYFAIGRYGTGKEGPEANAFADSVLDILKSGVPGAFKPIAVSRPDSARLALSRNYLGLPSPWHYADVPPRDSRAVPVVDIDVPYFHQIVDTPDSFDGGGSCGPSSMLMLLALWKKLPPRPVAITASFPHMSPFGGHLPEIDAKVCSPDLGAVHAWMLDYLRPYFPGVAIFYNEKATWELAKAELDAGRPVILGTQVTPAGHLMVLRGYLSDGRVLCNDPAGNQTLMARRNGVGAYSPTGNRYWNYEGRRAIYDWHALDVRWIMTFGSDSATPSTRTGDRPEDADLKPPR